MGPTHGDFFGAGSSGAVASIPPPWQNLSGVTCGAAETVAAGTNCGAVRREYWEKSVSIFHSADQTVAIGVHDCGDAEGGTGKNSFFVVLLAAPTVATIEVPEMFPSEVL